MLEGRYLLFCDSLDDVKRVRKSCLVESVSDHEDSESIHVIVYDDNVPIACGRLLMNDIIYEFDKIYVVNEKRHIKVGDFVLRLLIEKADLMCADKVYIKSNEESKDFFIKFGFMNINEQDECAKTKGYDLFLNINTYMNNRTCCG